MATNKPERYTETENFLIDTRKLPPELRWKIYGIMEAADVLNGYGAQTFTPTAGQQARGVRAGQDSA